MGEDKVTIIIILSGRFTKIMSFLINLLSMPVAVQEDHQEFDTLAFLSRSEVWRYNTLASMGVLTLVERDHAIQKWKEVRLVKIFVDKADELERIENKFLEWAKTNPEQFETFQRAHIWYRVRLKAWILAGSACSNF